MSRIVAIIVTFLFALSSSSSIAGGKNVVTRTFTVNGTCDQCKKRIEETAYSRGVKYAEWDVDSHTLTVKYDSVKTSPELILKKIAVAGHDSELFTASQEDYEKLPACCKYRSGIKKH